MIRQLNVSIKSRETTKKFSPRKGNFVEVFQLSFNIDPEPVEPTLIYHYYFLDSVV